MQQADTEDDEADLPDAVVRYGVKGALAARLLPSLIKVAKSENQQKLRKLLCHELTDVVFQWRESTYDRSRDGPLTTELHWQLYETLAKNRKLPALLIKLAANTQGKRNRHDFRDFHPSQYIPGWGKGGRGRGQSKPVTNAHTVLIELSKAARRWCYQGAAGRAAGPARIAIARVVNAHDLSRNVAHVVVLLIEAHVFALLSKTGMNVSV